MPTNHAIHNIASGLASPTVTEFTSSGTWTKPSGITTCEITLVGAGSHNSGNAIKALLSGAMARFRVTGLPSAQTDYTVTVGTTGAYGDGTIASPKPGGYSNIIGLDVPGGRAIASSNLGTHAWLKPGTCSTSNTDGGQFLFASTETTMSVNCNTNVSGATAELLFSQTHEGRFATATSSDQTRVIGWRHKGTNYGTSSPVAGSTTNGIVIIRYP